MSAAETGFLDQLDHLRHHRPAGCSVVPAGDLSPYVGVPAAEYLQRAGKGLRPALCLATCTAFGGEVEAALPSAAAIELLPHRIPRPRRRRGRQRSAARRPPSTADTDPRSRSTPGDGLAVLALGALRDNERPLGRRLAAQIWSEFDLMARQTVDGQARELGWQRDGRTDLTPDDYLDLIIQEDLLVHHAPAAAGRCADRVPEGARPRAHAPFRVLPRCRLPDPRRRAQPHRVEACTARRRSATFARASAP